MTGGDGRLERVWSDGAPERFRPGECGEAAPDKDVIPSPTVLIEEEHWLAGRTDARPQP